MKSIRNLPVALFILGGFIALISLLHAQEQEAGVAVQMGTATLTATPVQAMTDEEVMLQAVEATEPIPASVLTNGGTFWSASHAPGSAEPWAPLPSNFGMAAWALSGNVYILDDRQKAYQAEAEARTATLSATSGRMSLMSMGESEGGGFSMMSMMSSFPSNSLNIQIFCLSNGVAYLSLNNATDSVYEIMSEVALTNASWNIETEIWPTNTAAMPFTVPEGNRTNTLFFRAMDWTGVTSGGNATPDWWFWKYFGTVAISDTNLDSQGITLLNDYTNGLDPNVIQFSIAVTNNYVNSMTAPVSLNIAGGVPSYIAVLVNDTNLADASWQPYTTSSLNVFLGTSDGTYTVQIGLKGLPADAQQTWQSETLIEDTTAPQVIINNPTNGTVSVPTIQLQGCSPEELAGITFDVSNAVAVVTNQSGQLLSGQFFDTNLWKYTTNYFQCYDIPLTNGVNKITVHATDLAGNVTVTNFSYTLNYSTATNPIIKLTWPTNGMQICGSGFTLLGCVDDPTATVSASITDTNGNTNIVMGEVERTGVLWVENLPLAGGTNWLTLSVTNSAGFSSVTNLCVVKNDMSLALTSIDGDLWLPTVNVSGTVSDSSAAISVNGVQGTNNGNGTWSAANVPVSASGVASFIINATPTNDADPAILTNVDKAAEIVIDSAHWTNGNFLNSGPDFPEGTRDRVIGNFTWGKGGLITETFSDLDTNQTVIGTEWKYLTLSSNGTAITFIQITNSGGFNYATNAGPGTGAYAIKQEIGALSWSGFEGGNPQGWDESSQMKMALHTGGKSKSIAQGLFALTATATNIFVTNSPVNIPYPQITVDGTTLGSDGLAWKVYQDNGSPDVTPKVQTDMYGFTVDKQKYEPYIQASGIRLDPDIIASNAEFCVGQKMVFQLQFDPALPSGILVTNQNNWVLPAKYVNAYEWFQPDSVLTNPADGTYYLTTCDPVQTIYSRYAYDIDPPFCTYYQQSTWPLTQPETGAWWVTGGPKSITCFPTLSFTNGQIASFSAHGNFDMLRPLVSNFVDNPPSYATNVNGWLQLGDDNSNGEMSYQINVLSAVSGRADITQLINRDAANGSITSQGTGGTYWLDSYRFYKVSDNDPGVPAQVSANIEREFIFSDNPGIVEISSIFTANVHIADQFQDYIVFRPDSGIATNNIYVTLGVVRSGQPSWGWAAASTYSGGTWSTPTNSVTRPDWPDDSDTFPTWIHLFNNKL
jgi:hypothetical protein